MVSDLPSRPPRNDRCESIAPEFSSLLRSKDAPIETTGFFLFRLYLYHFGEHFFKGFVCLVVWVSLYPLQPVFVRSVLKRLDSRPDSVFGDLSDLALWIVLTSSAILQILALNHAFYHMYRFSARTKTTMMSALFRKMLRISQHCKLEFGAGKITTMMSVDSQRIAMAFVLSHWLWMGPFLCIVSLGLIYSEVGYVVVVPAVLVMIVVFIQARVAKSIGAYRRKIMKLTDKRISFTTEVLSGIRVIKANAWETSASKIVNTIRAQEMRQVRALLLLQAANTCLFFVAPLVICLSTFGVYAYLVENDVSVTKVITTLGYIFLLRLPMAIAPKAIGMAAEALVSFRRIENFLFHGTEIQRGCSLNAASSSSSKDGIEIESKDGIEIEMSKMSKNDKVEIFNIPSGRTFSWDPSREQTMKSLKGGSIRLKTDLVVNRGEFVCVCGAVGSGKSSLLSMLTNELFPTLAQIRSASIVTQTPWIQNVRIMFECSLALESQHTYTHRYVCVMLCCLVEALKKRNMIMWCCSVSYSRI